MLSPPQARCELRMLVVTSGVPLRGAKRLTSNIQRPKDLRFLNFVTLSLA